MEDQVEDKRTAPRWPFKEAVTFKAVTGQEFGGCLGYDLSVGGVRFRLGHFMPLGKELFLTIPLGQEKIFEVRGRVVWVNKVPHDETYSVGMKFVDENSDVRGKTELARILSRNRVSRFQGYPS